MPTISYDSQPDDPEKIVMYDSGERTILMVDGGPIIRIAINDEYAFEVDTTRKVVTMRVPESVIFKYGYIGEPSNGNVGLHRRKALEQFGWTFCEVCGEPIPPPRGEVSQMAEHFATFHSGHNEGIPLP